MLKRILSSPYLLLFWIIMFLIAWWIVPLAKGDIRKTCPSPICVITQDREWRTMNTTYVVNLLNVRNPVVVYVINKNPTNTHTLTLTIFSTPSPNVTDRTNNAEFWVNTATSPGNGTDCSTVASIAALSLGKCSVSPLSSAQVAIQFSGAVLAAGTPDTADVYLVQGADTIAALNAIQGTVNSGSAISATFAPIMMGFRDRLGNARTVTGNDDGTPAISRNTAIPPDNFGTFGALPQAAQATAAPLVVLPVLFDASVSQGFAQRGSNRVGAMTADPIAVISDGTKTAYTVGRNVTNPTAGLIIFSIVTPGAKELIYDRVELSCTVACSINIQYATTAGATCTALTPVNIRFQASQTASTSTVNHTCVTPPTRTSMVQRINIPANNTYSLNLRGMQSTGGQNDGLSIEAFSAITGDLSAQLFWHEP